MHNMDWFVLHINIFFFIQIVDLNHSIRFIYENVYVEIFFLQFFSIQVPFHIEIILKGSYRLFKLKKQKHLSIIPINIHYALWAMHSTIAKFERK